MDKYIVEEEIKKTALFFFVLAALYFAARILELYFFKNVSSDTVDNMTALFTAQLCRTLLLLIGSFGAFMFSIKLQTLLGAKINEAFAGFFCFLLASVIALVLPLPWGLVLSQNDTPLMPAQALYYEALDITAEPEIRCVSFMGVYGQYQDAEKLGDSDKYCRYLNKGIYFDTPAQGIFLAEKREKNLSVQDNAIISVYPNTGIPIAFLKITR